MNNLRKEIERLTGAPVSEQTISLFRTYRDFLLEKNKCFNLTAITDPDEIEEKHFIDSLAAYPFIAGKTADIGSGAGFPGIPLHILLPHLSFTLVDSLEKRVRFLRETCSLLSLPHTECLHARAEDLPKREAYDTVVSRAVSRLNVLAEYCLPFVKKGGLFIAYKGNDCREEIEEAEYALSLLGGTIEKTVSVELPLSLSKRKLLLIRKIKETPAIYPRGQNKPRKQPLTASKNKNSMKE